VTDKNQKAVDAVLREVAIDELGKRIQIVMALVQMWREQAEARMANHLRTPNDRAKSEQQLLDAAELEAALNTPSNRNVTP
jgi:hypothetical protein